MHFVWPFAYSLVVWASTSLPWITDEAAVLSRAQYMLPLAKLAAGPMICYPQRHGCTRMNFEYMQQPDGDLAGGDMGTRCCEGIPLRASQQFKPLISGGIPLEAVQHSFARKSRVQCVVSH